MPVKIPLPRYSLYLRLLSLSLMAGALYDAALAGLLLAAPELPARWLELPRPPGFYLHLLAVLLGMLAAFYALAAYDPRSYGGNVDVAIAGRAAAAGAMVLAARGNAELWGLYPLAAVDLGFAAVHAAFWVPIRRPRG